MLVFKLYYNCNNNCNKKHNSNKGEKYIVENLQPPKNFDGIFTFD